MVTFYCDEEMIPQDRRFFYEMLPYVSPKINRVVEDGNGILIECQQGDREEVEKNIGVLLSMIEEGCVVSSEPGIKTLEDHTDEETLNNVPIFDQLLERGDVRPTSEGSYIYGGIFLKILRYFDAKIDDFGRNTFSDIREYTFPALHPISSYEKGGYFDNFPHFMMFQTSLENDIHILDSFAKEGVGDGSVFKKMRMPKNVLRHAACVPVYEMLEDAVLPNDTSIEFLVSGKCFRNEGANVFELSRINEFQMNEYVFAGSPEQCEQCMTQAKYLWDFWQKTFSANTKLDTANDSFFASNYKKLQLFQLLGDSKREFKWKIPCHGSYVSCGSMNFHRTHFSKPYNIRNESQDYCYTSCFAFGIERLTFALLSQKGIDPAKWDAATHSEISKYVTL